MWLDEDRLKILGREIAHMHNITFEIKLSHARPVYDTETTLTKPLETIKSTFKDLPEEYAFLKETAAKVIAKMEKTDTSGFSYGYCHYDFIPKNFHFDDNNNLTLFDFDFAGKGYLVNDLMTFYIHLFFHVSVGRITQEKADEEFKILTDAYKQIRPLSQEELDTIPYLGFMFWVYFLGFYVDHFEDWSNTFLTPHFLKERVALMRKWVAWYCVF
jgi:Ser/Thr protein kinase RdoA (MazF antagonist)